MSCLQRRAIDMHMQLKADGTGLLSPGGSIIPIESEEQIFKHLNLHIEFRRIEIDCLNSYNIRRVHLSAYSHDYRGCLECHKCNCHCYCGRPAGYRYSCKHYRQKYVLHFKTLGTPVRSSDTYSFFDDDCHYRGCGNSDLFPKTRHLHLFNHRICFTSST